MFSPKDYYYNLFSKEKGINLYFLLIYNQFILNIDTTEFRIKYQLLKSNIYLLSSRINITQHQEIIRIHNPRTDALEILLKNFLPLLIKCHETYLTYLQSEDLIENNFKFLVKKM